MKIVKAFSYARVSTEEQSQHGYSLATQLQTIKDYAERNNIQIVREYVDGGYSGGTLNRPALKELLEHLDEVSLILFVKLDRWNRSIQNYYKIQEQLDKHNVKWNAILEQYNTETAQGILVTNIMLSVAENERRVTSERIKSVLDAKRKNGYLVCGSLPVGFSRSKTEQGTIAVPDVEFLEEVYNHFLISHSINGTANHFGCNYFRIQKLFKSETFKKYLGDRYANIENAMNHVVKKYGDKVYLFSSLLKCPECGCNMAGASRTYKTKKGVVLHQLYRCPHHNFSKSCAYKKVHFQRDIEAFLIDDINSHVQGEFVAKATKQPQKRKKKPVDNSAKIERLNHMYLNGRISTEEYDKRYLELTSQNLAEPITQADSRANAPHLEGDWLTLYETLNNENKRLFWLNLIDRIDIVDGKLLVTYK